MSGTDKNRTSQGLKTSRILILECARKLKVFDILDDRRGQKSSRIHGAVVPEHPNLENLRFSMALKDLRP